MLYYLAKYPSLLVKIHKKGKKIERQIFSEKCLQLYTIGYQVLKFKGHNCEWILHAICAIFVQFPKSKALRKHFYMILKQHGNLQVEGWVKNVLEIDG
jgi:hypothetical protein